MFVYRSCSDPDLHMIDARYRMSWPKLDETAISTVTVLLRIFPDRATLATVDYFRNIIIYLSLYA